MAVSNELIAWNLCNNRNTNKILCSSKNPQLHNQKFNMVDVEKWVNQTCVPSVFTVQYINQKNTFHMRHMTLSSISTNNGQVRQTLSAQAAGSRLRGKCMTGAAKSLELLRANIQSAINFEIDSIIKKYLEKFFQPAIENIRKNLGDESVNEETIRSVCRQILEEAKHMYYSSSESRTCSPFSEPDIKSEYGFVNSPFVDQAGSTVIQKRKDPDTDSEASQSVIRRKKIIRPMSSLITGRSTPMKIMKMESIKREGPKWDPSRIVKTTLFIMGARANKVLGFGQTRGRLYTKHPELFKYSGDTEDKEWLSSHNLMPPTGGKAYLLVLEDIRELAESDEYRNNPNVLLNELRGFETPYFMLRKIRHFVSQSRTDWWPDPALHANHLKILNSFSTNLTCETLMMTQSSVMDTAPNTPCDLNLSECPPGNEELPCLTGTDLQSLVCRDTSSQTLPYNGATQDSTNLLHLLP